MVETYKVLLSKKIYTWNESENWTTKNYLVQTTRVWMPSTIKFQRCQRYLVSEISYEYNRFPKTVWYIPNIPPRPNDGSVCLPMTPPIALPEGSHKCCTGDSFHSRQGDESQLAKCSLSCTNLHESLSPGTSSAYYNSKYFWLTPQPYVRYRHTSLCGKIWYDIFNLQPHLSLVFYLKFTNSERHSIRAMSVHARKLEI